MSQHLKLILQCKRCKKPFELLVGQGLLTYCETCFRILGRRRLPEKDQWGLNERRRQIEEITGRKA
jgi:hypothetical protein